MLRWQQHRRRAVITESLSVGLEPAVFQMSQDLALRSGFEQSFPGFSESLTDGGFRPQPGAPEILMR